MKAIAAAKHHTVLATEGGEVFTWGSNRGIITGYSFTHKYKICLSHDLVVTGSMSSTALFENITS